MRRRNRSGREPLWARAPERVLLGKRIRDLGLSIEGTRLEERIERLQDELEARGLSFRPRTWLSTTWFSPDGIPGFAIPFYLVHPRLARLERKHTGRVEGGTIAEFLRLLRHEAGHAFLSAYRLHCRPRWRELFGRYSQPYRASYRPDPRSRRHVRHLDGWYAQSHPAEDFCETFATWVRPRSDWRSRYAGWGALEKLEYVEEEMERISGRSPLVRSRERTESVPGIELTLREFFARRRARQAGSDPLDRRLREVFDPRSGGGASAAVLLRRLRPRLLRSLARRDGHDPYDVDQVLGRLIERARWLDLRLARRPGRERACRALLARAMEELLNGRRLEFRR